MVRVWVCVACVCLCGRVCVEGFSMSVLVR